MSEHLLFLTLPHSNRDGTSTDFDVRDGKPNGRAIGRICLSAGGEWFWCLNDSAPSPAADRGYAPTPAKAMLALKHRWRARALKRGKMQVGTPEWMKNRPE